jgi:hypothetical protein
VSDICFKFTQQASKKVTICSPVYACREANQDEYRFANDTREHALSILLRLTLDTTLIRDCGVCLEAENAIAALCREATVQSGDELVGIPQLLIIHVQYSKLTYTPNKDASHNKKHI